MNQLLQTASMARLSTNEPQSLFPPAKRWQNGAGERPDFRDATPGGAKPRGTGLGPKTENERISIQVRVLRFTRDEVTDYTMALERGTPLFAQMNTFTTPSGRDGGDGGGPLPYQWHNGSATPAFSLQVASFLAAKLSCVPTPQRPHGLTPSDFVNEFRLVGVVTTANQNLKFTSAIGANPEVAVDARSMYSQMTNFLARGVKLLDLVWLLVCLKQAERTERFMPTPKTRRLESVEMRNPSSKQRVTHYTAIVPYVTRTGYFPAELLLQSIPEDDGVGRLTAAQPIFLGVVVEGLRGSETAPDLYEGANGGGYYNNAHALPCADAVVDSMKALDYGFLDMMISPNQ